MIFPIYSLSLIRGKHLLIIPKDRNASVIVENLAEIISLEPWITNQSIEKDQELVELHITTDKKYRKGIIEFNRSGLVICRLPIPQNNDMLTVDMTLIGLAIARSYLPYGGTLIHGALIKIPADLGEGAVLLAGPSSVGKTTAANRILFPWVALADDASFIISSETGGYKAHPWPTWSNFYNLNNHIKSSTLRWDVQSGLNLKAIFFLHPAEKDFVEPMPVSSSITCLIETIQQVSKLMTRNLSSDEIQKIHKMELAIANSISFSIPTYTLHFSLNGSFWDEIEKYLIKSDFSRLKAKPSSSNLMTVSYSGPSMNPTLDYPDILEIIPCHVKRVQTGDIICFRQPENIAITVHRIAQINTLGIITRGDNNSEDDPIPVRIENVIGRVTAAWRYGKKRNIYGGFKGRLLSRYIRFQFALNRLFSKPLHKIYQKLYTSEISQCLLSKFFKFRVFQFNHDLSNPSIKIMFRHRIIGNYDHKNKKWQIIPPWRIFISESKLPLIR